MSAHTIWTSEKRCLNGRILLFVVSQDADFLSRWRAPRALPQSRRSALYPQLVRDILMRLIFAWLYHARSTTIEEEWTRNLSEKMPEQARAIRRPVFVMREPRYGPRV